MEVDERKVRIAYTLATMNKKGTFSKFIFQLQVTHLIVDIFVIKEWILFLLTIDYVKMEMVL